MTTKQGAAEVFAGALDIFRPCASSLRCGGMVTRKISNAPLREDTLPPEHNRKEDRVLAKIAITGKSAF